jgi:hypothetical protein
MYRNTYLAKYTEVDSDGYPVITGKFFKLFDTGITNRSITFTKTTDRSDYAADDTTESSNEIVTGYKGTFGLLGISVTAKAAIEDLVTDSNGNLICREQDSDDPKFVMVFQAKNEKGVAYQRWCYNVHITKATTENANQHSDEQDISYSYIGGHITNTKGQYVFYSDVLEGNTGWLDGATAPTTIYKEASAA